MLSLPPFTQKGISNTSGFILKKDNSGEPVILPATTDTDGDGVPDNVDIDDDNDGIPDEIECTNDFLLLTNGGFEDPVIPTTTWKLKDESEVPGWETTASDNKIELWSDNFLGVPSQEGNQFAELNATQVSTLYQTFTLDGSGGTLDWSLYHRGRRKEETAYVKIGPTLETATTQATITDGTSAWGFHTGTYTIPEGETVLVIAFESVVGGSLGNLLDDVSMALNQSCKDSDNDGIPNSLDLDSDNDGVSDIVEAGGVDANNDGEVDYPIPGDPTSMIDLDGDGLIDTYDDEDNGGNSSGWVAGVSILDYDSDEDGVFDRIDLDSDNDGIPDFVENVCSTCPTANGPSGNTTDTDNNGVLDIFENMNNDNTNNTTGSNIGVTPNVEIDDLEDTLPDYIDLDTDGDGAYDWIEGFDIDGNGSAANDIIGLALLYETNNGNPEDYPTTDSDGDDIPDWLDNLPDEIGYSEDELPPFLNHLKSEWIDDNRNGLADIFDEEMNGFMAPTPNSDNINDNDWRDNTTLSSLPVELLSFTAKLEDCNAKLEWATETEDNFDYFQLERSADGIYFEPIDQIYGEGGTTYQSYEYLDAQSEGNNYYRLQMVDFDGTFEYSDIIFLINDCDQEKQDVEFIVYPNPVGINHSEVYLKIKSIAGSAKILVCNMKGVVLNTVQTQFNKGWNNLSIDVSNFQTGVYAISYIKEDGTIITNPLTISAR